MSYSVDLKLYDSDGETYVDMETTDVIDCIEPYYNTVIPYSENGYLLEKEALADSSYNGEYYAVIIDGNDTYGSLNTNFGTYVSDDWMEVDTSTNPVKVFVSDNNTDEKRTGYIKFYHNAKETAYIILKIVQEANEKTITASSTSISNISNFETVTKKINVTVGGGCKKFYVKAINKYNSDGRQVSYDNAIVVSMDLNTYTINSDDTYTYSMTITTYGDLNTSDGYYYAVILAHANKRSASVSITLRFSTIDSYDIPEIPVYENYL